MQYRKSDAKAYARTHMKGLWVANLTPFAADLTLDEPGFRRNLRHWIDDLGIGGVFIAGKQAEFFSLSLAERKRILEIATDEAGDKCGVMISCSDENLDTVLDLADHAQAAGTDYIVVHSPPLYFHNTVDDVLYEYYRHICERVEIGVAIWHQPDYGCVMGPEVCARIAELPNIVAIKYSVPRDLYTQLTRMACDKLLVGGIMAGEHPRTRLAASTPPYLMQTKHDRRMQEYTNLALRGDIDAARRVRDSLDPVRAALRDTRPADKPQAHQKYWQELLGQTGGPVRRPSRHMG